MRQFVDTYTEVKRHHTRSVRERFRSVALDVLSAMGSDQGLSRPRVQFLYIHHTFKDELPALHKLLDFLAANFEIVSHTEAVNLILTDRIDRPYLSISSDDGFKNNLLAAQILEERGISACFFINPALIGETDFGKIEQQCADRLHFPPVEFLDWNGVSQVQKQGHEIGSHTMSHMRISEVPAKVVQQDIAETYEILTEKCGAVDHFAWPYGLFSDFNDEARKAVFDTGFTSCASAERGAHFGGGLASKEELCIRRDHILLDWPLSHIKYFLRKAAGGKGGDGYRF